MTTPKKSLKVIFLPLVHNSIVFEYFELLNSCLEVISTSSDLPSQCLLVQKIIVIIIILIIIIITIIIIIIIIKIIMITIIIIRRRKDQTRRPGNTELMSSGG